MELLLLSNSTLPGKAWLVHALPLIAGQVKGRRGGIHPLRWRDAIRDDYTAKVAAVMAPHGGQRNRYPQRRRPYRRH